MSDSIIKWSENQHLLIDLALHYLSILRRLVQGEEVHRERGIQRYAKTNYNLELRQNQLRGLFHYQSTGGRFIDVGLEANTSYWLSKGLDEALTQLDGIEDDLIQKLHSNPPSAVSIPRVQSKARIARRPRTKPKFGVPDISAIDSIPSRRKEVITTRVIRDTKKSNELKKLYQWKCQICGLSIQIPDKSDYCEAHHLMPLGERHGGPDNKENMICLCPNHHAQMDYGVLYIDSSTLTVFHADSTDLYHGKTIQLMGNHRPAKRYLDYHRDELCSYWLE